MKPQETFEERWKRYPEPAIEVRQLEIYKNLIKATKALEQQVKQTTSLVPTLNKETQPNEIQLGNMMGNEMEGIMHEPSLQELELNDEKKPIVIPNTSIPKVDEEWGNKLWEAVKKTYGKIESEIKPPIEEIDFDQKTLELEIRSEYGAIGSETSHESKAETFKTLPSYLGEYEVKSEIKKIPSQKLPSPPNLDIANLTALM